jgi:periplasmic mercuric ion binding protein
MKTVFILFISLLFILKGISQNSIVTATLSVKGNCDMCKDRIENAADIKGVKNCNWDEKTKVAKIVFDSKKTDMLAIEKAIAAAGYDTENVKADQKAYSKLPKCCRYNDGVCHDKKP